MYQASVPAFQKHLHALDGLLDKAAAYASAKKVDPSVLLSARLYPDMFELTRQVQAVTDFAKAAPARLAGVPVPSYPDTETTIPEHAEARADARFGIQVVHDQGRSQ